MTPFTTWTGIAAPLLRPNIDTDVIIPKPYLVTTSRSGLGRGLFAEWRYDLTGAERAEFVLNRQPFCRASILVAGANFGCGSSREHAVWALMDFGIRCVIAPSFASIFHENSFKNGLAPIVLPEADVERLAALVEAAPESPVAVDLVARRIAAAGGSFSFEMDEGRRQALLQGLDDIGVTLTLADRIAAFQERQKVERPWIHAAIAEHYAKGAVADA